MNKEEIRGNKMDYTRVIGIEQMKCSYICSHCGTSNLINNKYGYVICKWCGHKVTVKDRNKYDATVIEFLKNEYSRFKMNRRLK